MPLLPPLLLAALLPTALLLGSASATDLRIYPSFGEVRQQVNLTATASKAAAYELPFGRAAWNLVQPGSLSLTGAPLLRLHTRPTDRDWLSTQEGQPVTVVQAGQAPLPGTLIRADDLLVRLESGTYLKVQANELGFVGRRHATGPAEASQHASSRRPAHPRRQKSATAPLPCLGNRATN